MNFLKKLFGSVEKPVPSKSPDSAEEKFNQHLELLQQFKRTTYIPKVSPAKPEFSEHSKSVDSPIYVLKKTGQNVLTVISTCNYFSSST